MTNANITQFLRELNTALERPFFLPAARSEISDALARHARTSGQLSLTHTPETAQNTRRPRSAKTT